MLIATGVDHVHAQVVHDSARPNRAHGTTGGVMEVTGLEKIRSERPVKNTVHNLIQTLSVKTSSAARYGLYQDDAREDGMEDCAELFARLGQQEEEMIAELLNCLREHVGEAGS